MNEIKIRPFHSIPAFIFSYIVFFVVIATEMVIGSMFSGIDIGEAVEIWWSLIQLSYFVIPATLIPAALIFFPALFYLNSTGNLTIRVVTVAGFIPGGILAVLIFLASNFEISLLILMGLLLAGGVAGYVAFFVLKVCARLQPSDT